MDFLNVIFLVFILIGIVLVFYARFITKKYLVNYYKNENQMVNFVKFIGVIFSLLGLFLIVIV